MRVGSQRGLFTLRRRVQVGVSASNEPKFIWQDWRPDIFSEVSVKRGKEQFDPVAKKRYSEDVWLFRTRYDEVAGVDATMKIAHEENVYDIKAILPDGQKQWDCVIEATLVDGSLGGKALKVEIKSFIDQGVVGNAYGPLAIDVEGGSGPYQFSGDVGAPGLSLDAETGKITGTPTEPGEFAVSISVIDAAGTVEMLPVFNITVEVA